MKGKKLTRREFLISLATAVGGSVVFEAARRVSAQGELRRFFPLVNEEARLDATFTPTATSTPLPTSTRTPVPTQATVTPPPIPGLPPLPEQSVVSHVRHASVTNWGGPNSGQWYYQRVDQAKVNAMLLAGLRDLTDKQSETESWDYLFRRISAGGYQPGQKVAIKVNFNCASIEPNNCNSHNNLVDTLPQVVLSLAESLRRAGVAYSDIYIYDATAGGKPFYSFFRQQFSGKSVHFVGTPENCGGVEQCAYGKHSSMTVNFASWRSSRGLLPRKLTDTLYDATYLINVPILKAHSGGSDDTGFTAAFKNHLGSIDYVNPGDSSPDNIHNHIYVGHTYFNKDVESPLVTIYKNPHIGGKTVLTVMDGLFGSGAKSWSHDTSDVWDVFKDSKGVPQPANSLFFALDPVALDCVAADIVHSEPGTKWHDYDPQGTETRPYLFLQEAARVGLGRFESRYPYVDGTNKYTTIVYRRRNLS